MFFGIGVAILLLVIQAAMSIFPFSKPQASPVSNRGLDLPILSAPTQSVSSAVTFEEALEIEHDSSLTEFQKDDFCKKHEGKTIEWQAQVVTVQRVYKNEPESDILVVMGSAVKKSRGVDRCSSIFPPRWKKDDLVDLRSGDIIRFRGTLRFSYLHTATVEQCGLLERRRE
jgi:hypothetical protein